MQSSAYEEEERMLYIYERLTVQIPSLMMLMILYRRWPRKELKEMVDLDEGRK